MYDLKNTQGSIVLHLLNADEQVTDGVMAVPLNEGSVRHVELMSSDYVKLKFSLLDPIMLKRGFWIEVNGRRYSLCDAYFPTYNSSTEGFDYDVQFDAWYYSWNRYILKLDPTSAANETTFDYTCRLGDHCKLIYDAVRQYHSTDNTVLLPTLLFHVHLKSGVCLEYKYVTDAQGAEVWTRSEVEAEKVVVTDETNLVEDEADVISYQGVHIVDAITSIAEQFECEWWIEEKTDSVVFHFGRCENAKAGARTWKIGTEMASMSRSESDDDYSTRVYAYGSTTNVPARYRKHLTFTATNTESYENYRYHYGVTSAGEDSYTSTPSSPTSMDEIVNKFPEINLGSITMPFSGDVQISGTIPFTAKAVETALMTQSYIIIKKDNTEVARVIPSMSFGTQFSGTLEKECSFSLTLSNAVKDATYSISVLLTDYFIKSSKGTAKLTLTFSAGSLVFKHSTNSYLRMCDTTRKMLTSYFSNSCKSYDDALTYNFGELSPTTTSTDNNSGVFPTLSCGDVEIGKYKVTDYLCFCCKASNGATLTLTVNAYVGDLTGTPKTCATYSLTHRDGKWECNDESQFIENWEEATFGSTTIYEGARLNNAETINIQSGGVLYLVISWTKSSSAEAPTIQATRDKSYTNTPLVIETASQNAMVTTTMTAGGVDYPCYLNTAREYEYNDDAQWLCFENTDEMKAVLDDMVTKTAQFTLADVKEYNVPVSYFTNDFANDANISGYEKRIMLPLTYEGDAYADILGAGKNYVQSNSTSASEVVESEVVFDDIYPSKELTIAKVVSFEQEEDQYDDDGTTYKVKKPWYRFYIKKSTFPFEDEYKSTDSALSCFFTSGLLAGMTFELEFEGDSTVTVDGETTQSYVIQKTTSGNIDLPNPTLVPKEGDTIAMINYDPTAISGLTLVSDAESRLLREAVDYLKKVSKDCGTYTPVLASDYAYDLYNIAYPSLGDKINLVHEGYFETTYDEEKNPTGRVTRIIGYEIKLDIPYDSPSYTVGESSAYSRLSDIEKQLRNASSATSSTAINYTITPTGSSSVDLTGYATETWVKSQGFLTEHQSLSGYATESWVEAQGYLVSSSLEGYATESWVEAKKYLIASDIEGKQDKIDNLDTIISNAEKGAQAYSNLENYLPLTGGTLTGKLVGTDITVNGTLYASRIVFGEDAELLYDTTTKTIKATSGFWSSQFISAFGINTGGSIVTGDDIFVKSLDFVDGKIKINYGKVGDIGDLTEIKEEISELDTRVDALESKATNVSFTQTQTSGLELGTITIDNVSTKIYGKDVNKANVEAVLTGDIQSHTHSQYLTEHQSLAAYATMSWVEGKKYLTTHQTIYALTIKKNGTEVGTYTPNSTAKSIDITDVASAETLSGHIGDDTHLASGERNTWNNKLDASVFDSIFEIEKNADGTIKDIKAKYGFYSTSFVSAFGVNSEGGGSTSYDRLDAWSDYDSSKSGWVLSAYLGNDLNTRLTAVINSEGKANGIAMLDGEGRISSSNLPSYVDDVLEYDTLSLFPATGETGKIYVAKDTNKTYRWSGSGYVEISASLALGETSSTAFAGNRGKALEDATSDIATIRSNAANGNTAYNSLSKYLLLSGGTLTGALSGTTASFSSSVTASSFVKSNGTSSQFLKADGSVDSSAYLTSVAYNDLTTKPTASQLETIIGNYYAYASHTHTKSQITDFAHTHLKAEILDFPTSMPASDVYAWAKASSKPSYTFSELTSHPTTLSGYGITDAMSTSHPAYGITDALITKWDNMLPLTGGTLTGALIGTTITGEIHTKRIVFGDGVELVYDDSSNSIHATAGFWSSQFISSYGINTGGTVTADTDVFVKSLDFVGGKIKVNYGKVGDIGDLTEIKEEISELDTRVTALESKSTNVSYTQTLTSGVKVGAITIDGISTDIYTLDISGKADKATTLSGYGITDAMSTSHPANSITSANISSWNGKWTYDEATIKAVKVTAAGTADSANAVAWGNVDGRPINIVNTFGSKSGDITVRGNLKDNGSVNLAMSNNELQASIEGLGSAAYTASTAYATAAQGTKADNAFAASSFTQANIKSTLGISDWALASSKPTYSTSEVSESGNLYFTTARAQAALGDHTSNTTIHITSTERTNWNAAYGWGNHANAGYASVVNLNSHVNNTSNPHSVTASQVGLGNVENTKLSTWAGSSYITTLGTITTGTWHGSKIADSYISSASTWNAKQDALTTAQINACNSGITSSKVSNYDTAYDRSHTHDNKTILDGISADNINSWTAAGNSAHSHSNKSVLDGITSAQVTNWNTAYTNNHTHSNKSVLDGITSSLITTWNTKQNAISDLSTIRSNASLGATAYNSLGNYLLLTGGTLTGDLSGTNFTASGNVTANKVYAPEIVFGSGASLKYDSSTGTIQATTGFWSSQFISAYGTNTGGTITSGNSSFVKSLDFVDGKIKVNYGNFENIVLGQSSIKAVDEYLIINNNCKIDDNGDIQLVNGSVTLGDQYNDGNIMIYDSGNHYNLDLAAAIAAGIFK